MSGPAATELLLIRHAESLANAEGRWQGHDDSPLSDAGRAQARALAREIGALRVDALFASPLVRAAETAAILSSRFGRAPQLEPQLIELDAGAWAGLTRDEIRARWPRELEHFDSGDPDAPAPGGESRRELGRRVGRAVAAIAAAHPRARVVLVTHLGVISMLLPGVQLKNAECRSVASGELDLAGLATRGLARAAR